MRVAVAIGAPLERDRLFEIPISVTLRALKTRMLAEEWELGTAVVKLALQSCHRHRLPSVGRVACLAAVLKRSSMWIAMARGT